MGSSDSAGALDVGITVTHSGHVISLLRLERLLKYAATREGLTGELGVWLCTDAEISDLHQRYMSIAGPTDVITFPADDADHGGYLGDIAVSLDTAIEQAREIGHSAGRETAYLCLHGLLHIAGYDDQDESSQGPMLRRQEELLNEFERRIPGSWSFDSDGEPRQHDTE